MNPTPKPTTIEELARELAASWLEHLYLPGKGTCEAYVAAREALVLAVYPEFKEYIDIGPVPKKREQTALMRLPKAG